MSKPLIREKKPHNHLLFRVLLDPEANEMYVGEPFLHLVPDNINPHTRLRWYKEKIRLAIETMAGDSDVCSMSFNDILGDIVSAYHPSEPGKRYSDSATVIPDSFWRVASEGEAPTLDSDIWGIQFCIERDGPDSDEKVDCMWRIHFPGHGMQTTQFIPTKTFLELLERADNEDFTRQCTIEDPGVEFS